MCCESVCQTLDEQFDSGRPLGAGLGPHLAACPDCAAHLNELRRLEGAMRCLEGTAPVAGFVTRLEHAVLPARRRPARALWPVCAAAAFAFLGDAWVPWERTVAALPYSKYLPALDARGVLRTLGTLAAGAWNSLAQPLTAVYWPAPAMAALVAVAAVISLIGLNVLAAGGPAGAWHSETRGHQRP